MKEEPSGDTDRPLEASQAPGQSWHRGPPPAGWHGSAPPVGWHGNAGPPPPTAQTAPAMPPHAAMPPHRPAPYGAPLGPPPDGYGARPDVRYEARPSPYASPFAAVPPPASLDADYRRGGKGKGAHIIGHVGPLAPGEREIVDVQRGPQPDGLMVERVPPELNSLDVLNRHFRQFGEVLKITIQVADGRAFVQFAERASAEAAAAAVVLGNPDIALSWVARGKGRGKGGKGKGDKSERPMMIDRPIENRVLVSDPEEQRRLDESKRKRDEIHNRKAALLASYTEQMKVIMLKLNDANLPEAKQEAYRALLLQMKGKMDALNAPPDFSDSVASATGVAASPSSKRETPSGKGDKGGRFSLDLRSRVLRINVLQGWTLERVRDELQKVGASDDKVRIINWDVADNGEPSTESTLVQFKDRWSAEQVFNLRSEFPSYLEWSDKTPAPARVSSATSSPLLLPEEPPAGGDVPLIEAVGGDAAGDAAMGEAGEASKGGAKEELVAAEPAAVDSVVASAVIEEVAAETADVVPNAATTEVAPETAAPEAAPDAALVAAPEAAKEAAQEVPAPEAAAQVTPAAAMEAAPEAALEGAPEAAPEAAPEVPADLRVDLSEEEDA